MSELTFLEEVTIQEYRLELVDDCVARTRNLSGLLTAEEALEEVKKTLAMSDISMWKYYDMDGYEPDVSSISLKRRGVINSQKLYELDLMIDHSEEIGYEIALKDVYSIITCSDEVMLEETKNH